MFTVSPSLYSADLLNLQNVLERVKEFENLHLDIDDGNFVRGISFGMDLVERVAKFTNIPLDAHLEVLNPMDYAIPLAKAGVTLISAHIEALPFPGQFLADVHRYGAKAGLALNIKTPAVVLEPYVDMLEQVIFVSCEAEDDGLPLCEGVLKKVRQAREILPPSVLIWVDGGVNESNLASVVDAGADGIVVGRAVFAAEDPVKAYRRLVSLGNKYQKEQEKTK